MDLKLVYFVLLVAATLADETLKSNNEETSKTEEGKADLQKRGLTISHGYGNHAGFGTPGFVLTGGHYPGTGIQGNPKAFEAAKAVAAAKEARIAANAALEYVHAAQEQAEALSAHVQASIAAAKDASVAASYSQQQVQSAQKQAHASAVGAAAALAAAKKAEAAAAAAHQHLSAAKEHAQANVAIAAAAIQAAREVNAAAHAAQQQLASAKEHAFIQEKIANEKELAAKSAVQESENAFQYKTSIQNSQQAALAHSLGATSGSIDPSDSKGW